MGLLAAIQFLTILPVRRNFSVEQLGRSSVYFPLVGLMIGLLLAALNWGLVLILPGEVVNLLLIVTLIIFTGGLHMDGLADTLDGMAGHRTPEERLAIMKDSRIGSFGAIGIVLILLAEYAILNNIPDANKIQVLILAPVMSRWAMVNSIFVYPSARSTGLGRTLKENVKLRHLFFASLVTLVAATLLFRWSGLIIMAGVWLLINLQSLYISRRLKGLTGDIYGLINEVSFVSVLLITLLLVRNHWLV